MLLRKNVMKSAYFFLKLAKTVTAFCSLKNRLSTFDQFPIFALIISTDYESIYRSGWSKT
jgi:hypothetical protein